MTKYALIRSIYGEREKSRDIAEKQTKGREIIK
jgi:hypothetical protein